MLVEYWVVRVIGKMGIGDIVTKLVDVYQAFRKKHEEKVTVKCYGVVKVQERAGIVYGGEPVREIELAKSNLVYDTLRELDSESIKLYIGNKKEPPFYKAFHGAINLFTSLPHGVDRDWITLSKNERKVNENTTLGDVLDSGFYKISLDKINAVCMGKERYRE
ncbi:MAG: hypothetical protein ABIG89_05445 [Candidatus Woesearchaeota archaeon]